MLFLKYGIFMITILCIHSLSLMIYKLNNKNYFFGVYITQINMEEKFRDEVIKDFKFKLNITLWANIVIYLLLLNIFKLNIGLSNVVGITIYLIILYFILISEFKKVKNTKNNYLKNHPEKQEKYDMTETITLNEDEKLIIEKQKLLKKFKILFGISILISVSSFLYVLLNYNSMPDTIVTHWSINGIPDGYAQKNILNVFFMNFIDICLVLILAFSSIASINQTIYLDEENLEENIKKTKGYLNKIGYSFFILTISIQSLTSTTPIFLVQQKDIPIYIILVVCILPILIVIPLCYYYIMLSNLKSKEKSIYLKENDDEKWIYGMIYYNKDDNRLLVDKRMGIGWNLNMAHPGGKVFGLGTFVLLLGSILVCFI